MTDYTIFNIVWFTVSLSTAWLFTRDRRKIARIVRMSAVVVLLSFPWDCLAVAKRAWDYGTPGPRLFGVPLNDLLFIFSCSAFSGSLLLSQAIGRSNSSAEPQKK